MSNVNEELTYQLICNFPKDFYRFSSRHNISQKFPEKQHKKKIILMNLVL